MGFLTAAVAAFGAVFLAELGDKTQMLALNFGARYPLKVVVVGLTIGFGVAGAIATLVGGLLGAALPERPIEIAGGLLFLGFALFGLRSRADDDGDDFKIRAASSVVASIALTIALAEMGDKTQLATAALAAKSNPLGTWLGATVGEVSAAMAGAVAGNALGERIPRRGLELASAFLFAAFGLAMLSGRF